MLGNSSISSISLGEGVDAFEAVEGVWNALADKGRLPPFQRYEWARTWLRHLGVGATPLILKAGDPVTAILPLALRRVAGMRVLSLVGEGVSDYLGIVAERDDPDVASVFGGAIRDFAGRFDLLDFRSFLHPAATRAEFLRALSRPSAERLYERCPVVDTTGSWDDYLKSRTRKFRANQKRAVRRVEAQGAVEVARAQVDESLFEELLAVERQSWKWAHGTAFLGDPGRRAFLQELLLENKVPHELWTCKIGAELAAFAVVFRGGDSRYYYLPSFRGQFADSGTFLMGEIVRDSFASSVQEFDFLQGDESYKLAWSTRERSVQQVSAAGRRLGGRAALLALRGRWWLSQSERLRGFRSSQLVTRLLNRTQ